MLSDFWRRPRGVFTPQVIAEACRHAAAQAPLEACGLVRAGRYHPCENASAAPQEHFIIAPEILADAVAAGNLEGVIHSHPNGPWRPSEADMRGQIETKLPWAIVGPGGLVCAWGDALENPPLFCPAGEHQGREFCHGASDCYTLIRDWYAQARGQRLPDFARGWNWWREGADLYRQNFAAAGFTETQSPAPGDVFLMAIRSEIPNHAGVYLGENLALEHLPERLSCRRPMAARMRRISAWLRHESLKS